MSTRHVMARHPLHTFLTGACVLMLAPIILVACATPPSPRQASFDPHEYAPYAKDGSGSISGQVSLKTVDGAVTSGGGCKEVYLDPVTSYSTEWLEREVMKNETLATPDSRAMTYRRITSTDGAGFFRFERVPAGSYYVACRMQFDRWIMNGSRPINFLENVWVHARVDLEPGQHGRTFLAH